MPDQDFKEWFKKEFPDGNLFTALIKKGWDARNVKLQDYEKRIRGALYILEPWANKCDADVSSPLYKAVQFLKGEQNV